MGHQSDAMSCISSAGDATSSIKGSEVDHDSLTTDQGGSYSTSSYYGYYYPGWLMLIKYTSDYSSLVFFIDCVFMFSHLTIACSQVMMVPMENWTTKGTMLAGMEWNFNIL